LLLLLFPNIMCRRKWMFLGLFTFHVFFHRVIFFL
jgi:hypothetical protein